MKNRFIRYRIFITLLRIKINILYKRVKDLKNSFNNMIYFNKKKY